MGAVAEGDIRAAQYAALAAIDWSDVVKRLENLARSLGASPSNAEDAVQTAIAALCEHPSTWNRKKHPDVTRHLAGAVRNALRRSWRSAQGRHEAMSGLMDEAAAPPSDRAARERQARADDALARLRAALAGDPEAAAVLEMVFEGVDKPAQQAARLGWPVEKVYDARDRIGRHVRRIGLEQASEIEKEEVAQ